MQGTIRSTIVIGSATPTFCALKIRENILVRPPAVTELSPLIVIASVASHIELTVDGRRSTEHLTSRLLDVGAIEIGFRSAAELPGIGSSDRENLTNRQTNKGVPVRTTRFLHQYSV